MKIDSRIKEALEATGLPWVAENGGKHIKVKLSGRLACILPKGANGNRGGTTRACLNAVSQIRAIARSVAGAEQ